MYKFYAPVFISLLFPLLTLSQPAAKIKWIVKNPFEQKVFIENKGQYEIPGASSKEILFGARLRGLNYYFTNHSVWIEKDSAINLDENGVEPLTPPKKSDEPGNYKLIKEFHQMEFSGANSLSVVTGESEISWYSNFTISKKTPVKAQAYKKLIYQNLYPGIDMEFYFRPDTTGFEYSFIVHPDADVSQIKIQYPLSKGLQFNYNGNILIQTPLGLFIDHAPAATQNNKSVACAFSVNNSVVGFALNNYNKNQTLVIDPWMVVPNYTSLNDAYDVDWDNAGNCYAYGGYAPWQLIKYDTRGNILWIYTEPWTDSNVPTYGGFAVDKISQSAYIIEGCDNDSGANIIKLNSAGADIASFHGDTSFHEMWRITFNRCTDKGVIAGGGYPGNIFKQACYLDTTLTNLTPINVLNTAECCHDMWGVATDDYGNCYMATANPYNPPDDSFLNVLLKMPMPSLTPVAWMVNDHYNFDEATSVGYAHNYYFGFLYTVPNGYNGMAMSNTHLYTYDAVNLKKWNSNSGVMMDSVSLNGGNVGGVYYGGLTSDDCDNIFAGHLSSIKQYNGSLNFIDSIIMPGTIYDVKLSNNDILFSGGAGFVAAINVDLPSCNRIAVSNSVTNSTCNPNGSAVVTPTGGITPYSVTWNTTPVQTGDTAKELNAGTYIATIIDNPISCKPDTIYDTVQIQSTGGKDSVSVNNASICNGESVILTASGASNFSWSPSTGLNQTTGDSVIAQPITTTTYTIIGTGNGCSDTVQSVVTIVPAQPLIIMPQPPPVICFTFQSDTLRVASKGSDFTWSPSEGLSATTGATVIANPSVSVTYTVTGLDSLGCPATGTEAVTILQIANQPSFHQHGDTLISSAKYDNQWYRNDTILLGDTSQDLIISALGNYYVEINNEANGCSTSSDTVAITTLTGINHLSINNNQLSVYPNPFNNNLFIKINSSAEDVKDWTMQLTDELGRTLYSMYSLNYSNEIDLSNLPCAMYFITVITKTDRVVVPVVKQN